MPDLPASINCRGRLLDFGRARVMAIVNLSPESFFDGARAGATSAQLIERVGAALDAGADLVDLGGASSKPGIAETPLATERQRVTDALDALAPAFPEAIFSVDTYRAEVAAAALDRGAALVNDISGGTADPQMWPLLGERRVPFVAMHRAGASATMQDAPAYPDGVVETVFRHFSAVLAKAREYDVDDVVLDPGFGFGKTDAHNFTLLARLRDFRFLRTPILVGLSRKSMLCRTVGVTPAEALNATTAAHVLALQGGANVLRVHDVRAAVEAIAVYEAFREHDPYGLPAVPLH